MQCRLPAILNAQYDNGSMEVGQADYYTCNQGYEFSNGEQRRMMVCQLDGSWIPDDSCWSRFKYSVNLYSLSDVLV